MRIIVCIKPVIRKETIAQDLELRKILNNYDKYALYAAVELKKKYGGEIIVLSMAPGKYADQFRKFKYYGVDRVVIFSDELFAGSDTYATADILATGIKMLTPFDLVLCGECSSEGETGQVPGELAALLGINYISYGIKIYDIHEGKIIVCKTMDNRELCLEVTFPLLVSISKKPVNNTIVTLGDIRNNQNYKPEVWNNKQIKKPRDQIGLAGSLTKVRKTYQIEHPKFCEFKNINQLEDIVKIFQTV